MAFRKLDTYSRLSPWLDLKDNAYFKVPFKNDGEKSVLEKYFRNPSMCKAFLEKYFLVHIKETFCKIVNSVIKTTILAHGGNSKIVFVIYTTTH